MAARNVAVNAVTAALRQAAVPFRKEQGRYQDKVEGVKVGANYNDPALVSIVTMAGRNGGVIFSSVMQVVAASGWQVVNLNERGESVLVRVG